MASVNRNKLIQPRRQLTALLPLLSSSTALVPAVGLCFHGVRWGVKVGPKPYVKIFTQMSQRKKERTQRKAKSRLDRTPRATPKNFLKGRAGAGRMGSTVVIRDLIRGPHPPPRLPLEGGGTLLLGAGICRFRVLCVLSFFLCGLCVEDFDLDLATERERTLKARAR